MKRVAAIPILIEKFQHSCAKASGVEGFVHGVSKGIIGAVAQPVSVVLDLLSKTTKGENAIRMKISVAVTSGDLLLSRRLP
ncbi:hypothetical protein Tco_0401397 [Tanacetum coccineum]